ncbi:hypothetical protein [Streptomyces sp. NPDC056492]|uniref:hypothetical protein n=1 Tax=unclassified Streptomyces TaxID=2593676 RepID=UPI00368B2C9C
MITTVTDTRNHGEAEARAWDRIPPEAASRSARLERDGELPIVEGALVRLNVEYLSKEREATQVWPWSSKTGATEEDMDPAGRCSSGDSTSSTPSGSENGHSPGPSGSHAEI